VPKRFSPCHYVGNLTFLIWWHGNFHFKMKEIQLTKGYVALVDDEDFERVSQFKWRVSHRTYAVRSYVSGGRVLTQLMHRFIMGVTDPNVQVDHIFHNGLDNQKKNLRLATNSQNQKNSLISPRNKSGYKGVCWHKRAEKYSASYGLNGKRIAIGYFDCPIEAARNYNKVAVEHGEGFEFLNDVTPKFPTEEYITKQSVSFAKRERIDNYLSALSKGLYGTSPGVTFNKKDGKWKVVVRRKYIGYYSTQDEAIAARDAEINK
jgi:hypothetical protein